MQPVSSFIDSSPWVSSVVCFEHTGISLFKGHHHLEIVDLAGLCEILAFEPINCGLSKTNIRLHQWLQLATRFTSWVPDLRTQVYDVGLAFLSQFEARKSLGHWTQRLQDNIDCYLCCLCTLQGAQRLPQHQPFYLHNNIHVTG